MLLEEIGFKLNEPFVIQEDNEAVEKLVKKYGASDLNKHIRVKYHFVRECVREKVIKFIRVASKDNPADALTKVAKKESFGVLIDKSRLIAVIPAQSSGGC